MSSIGSLLGTAGGAGGSGFSGPKGASIANPVLPGQTQTAYEQVQDALRQQQAFVQATQAQNGLGNQSNVFNQLSNVAQGQGPNPAQAMLAQATGANVANQAAMMAGQRGSSANPALIARQAAQQGAATQQQAAGQGATMQANQSLAALQNMGQLANQQVNQQQQAQQAYSQGAQGEQSNLFNSLAGVNSANVGMQSNINNANSQLAGIRMQGQQQMIGKGMDQAGSAMGLLAAEGGEVPQPEAIQIAQPPMAQTMAPPMNQIPGNPEQMQIQQIPDAFAGKEKSGGGGGGIMKMLPMLAMLADGGAVGPRSKVGQHFAGNKGATPSNSNGSAMLAKGGAVPAMVSPGEVYLAPKDVKKVEKGADPLSVGERIPGKAKTKGDNYANDTVPKTLESGGIVLPKSVMEAKHPHWEAHKFVSAILAKQGKSMPKKSK